MKMNGPQHPQTSTTVLNWLFAIAIAVVACAIGSVTWYCVDSVQKNASKLSRYHSTADNTKIDSQKYDLAKENLDKRILTDKMDPSDAILAQVIKLEGAELALSKGFRAMEDKQYDQAESDLTTALTLLPTAPLNKTTWHVGPSVVDKNAFKFFAYQARSFCYLKTGHSKLAIDDLTASIKLRPEYAGSYENRAKAYYLRGERALGDADMATMRSLLKRTAKAK